MKVVSRDAVIKNSTLVKLPPPPRYFCPTSKASYKKIGEALIKADRLKEHHLVTLEILAQNHAQFQYAIKAINAANRKKAMSGFIQKFTTGATNVSPEVTLKEKAEKQIFICLKRFGLDPKSEKELEAGNQLKLPFGLNEFLSKKGA